MLMTKHGHVCVLSPSLSLSLSLSSPLSSAFPGHIHTHIHTHTHGHTLNDSSPLVSSPLCVWYGMYRCTHLPTYRSPLCRKLMCQPASQADSHLSLIDRSVWYYIREVSLNSMSTHARTQVCMPVLYVHRMQNPTTVLPAFIRRQQLASDKTQPTCCLSISLPASLPACQPSLLDHFVRSGPQSPRRPTRRTSQTGRQAAISL